MSLVVEVGCLAELIKHDAHGADLFRKQLRQLNKFLATVNLNQHKEPENCSVFSADLYGYSGLHYMRRIAAYLSLRGVLPEPGGKDLEFEDPSQDPSQDPVVEEYYQMVSQVESGFDANLFKHLMFHDDSQGFYIPQDFSSVLFPSESLGIGGAIGSSQKLNTECTLLAAALELPLNLDYESTSMLEDTDSQGACNLRWIRYRIESFVCLRLHKASEHSLKTGAAIVFC